MKKRKIYIHIGTHKTGTTTIQNVLENNADSLKKDGIIFLGTYIKLFTEFSEENKCNDKSYLLNVINELHKDLDSYKNDSNCKFIISNEKLSGDKNSGYQNSNELAKSLKTITEKLNLDATIIVFIRSQDEFIESLYTQRIYNGETFTFDEYLSMMNQNWFRWDKLLDSYAYHFGIDNILCGIYDKQYLPNINSLVNQFGNFIKSKFLKNYTTAPDNNSGYSKNALQYLQTISPYLDNDQNRILKKILKRTNPKKIFEGYSFFTEDQRTEIIKTYSASNNYVLNKYFHNQSEKLFPNLKATNENSIIQNDKPEENMILLTKALLSINSELESTKKELKQISKRKGMLSKLLTFSKKKLRFD